MFIASKARERPARFGGAETNVTNFQSSLIPPLRTALAIRRLRSINIPLLRSEETVEFLPTMNSPQIPFALTAACACCLPLLLVTGGLRSGVLRQRRRS